MNKLYHRLLLISIITCGACNVIISWKALDYWRNAQYWREQRDHWFRINLDKNMREPVNVYLTNYVTVTNFVK